MTMMIMIGRRGKIQHDMATFQYALIKRGLEDVTHYFEFIPQDCLSTILQLRQIPSDRA